MRLCSTYVGSQTFEKANAVTQSLKTARYNKTNKEYIGVDYPQIIRECNSYIGGVDLINSNVGRNGLSIKTVDTMTRIFYHLLDKAVTNAFILYRGNKAPATERKRYGAI